MSENVTAIVRMEEGYMRLTLEYINPEFKIEICKEIAKIEMDLKIYPEVIHRRDSDKKCFTSIEFSGDDYTCDRTCGEFIEKVVTGLGIETCIND
jgi:hypothetical protein